MMIIMHHAYVIMIMITYASSQSEERRLGKRTIRIVYCNKASFDKEFWNYIFRPEDDVL